MSTQEKAHCDLNYQFHTLHIKLVGIGNALTMFAIGAGLADEHTFSIEMFGDQTLNAATEIDGQQSKFFALRDQLREWQSQPSSATGHLHAISDELDLIHSKLMGIGEGIRMLGAGLEESTDISTGRFLAIDFLGEQVLETAKELNGLQSNNLFLQGFGHSEDHLKSMFG